MRKGHTVLKGGRLIDGTGSEPVDDSVLVMKDDLIESVGSAGSDRYPQDAEVIDVTGKTIMPGLIDAHIHLFGHRSMGQITWFMDEPLLKGMRSVMDIWKLIDAGFTTVRDLGGVNALYLKRAVNEGSVVGPRILAAGRGITQTGGHGDIIHSLPAEWSHRLMLCRIADGVSEVRKAAREQLREGADFLKIFTTGGVMSERDVSFSSQYCLEEIRAFVEEAHNVGVRTASHAQGTQGIKNALLGGVETIEHGIYLDEECIDMMIKKGRYLVPTLAIFQAIVTKGAEAGVLESSIRKAGTAQEAHVESFKNAYEAGVKCGLGTDYLSDPMSAMGENAIELQLYVEVAGLTPMEAIVCATRNNAEVLNLADEIGTLEPGKCADLLVVDGDPSQDISILRDRKNILRVYRGGAQVPRLPCVQNHESQAPNFK